MADLQAELTRDIYFRSMLSFLSRTVLSGCQSLLSQHPTREDLCYSTRRRDDRRPKMRHSRKRRRGTIPRPHWAFHGHMGLIGLAQAAASHVRPPTSRLRDEGHRYRMGTGCVLYPFAGRGLAGAVVAPVLLRSHGHGRQKGPPFLGGPSAHVDQLSWCATPSHRVSQRRLADWKKAKAARARAPNDRAAACSLQLALASRAPLRCGCGELQQRPSTQAWVLLGFEGVQ